MFKINRLKLQIRTNEQSNPDIYYGFDIPFENGLNIIAGENSKGKSTISSCIYYGLGMEELLGGQNKKVLDKSLKSEFNIYDEDVEDNEQTFTVKVSRVLIEIENSLGELSTLERYITSSNDNENKGKFIISYNDKIANINKTTKSTPLYLRANNNNSNTFGFYSWFSRFIGVELPTVTNVSKSDNLSPLYLQTIFSGLFIEQTKGWSDFFATVPYFGIPKTKEKIVEFILNLNELSVSSDKDRINNEINELKKQWASINSRLDLISSEYNATIKDVPIEITSEKNDFNTSSLLIFENDEPLTIDELITFYTEELKIQREKPLLLVGNNKLEIRGKLENLYLKNNELLENIEDFDLKFNLQLNQKATLEKHKNKIINELVDQKGIQQVFDRAVIKEDIYNKCPTCSQEVSDDLISSEHVKIERMTLDENVLYLTGQKKLIESSLNSLSKTIKEKLVLRKYYINKQREYEEEIKVILKELISDDREFSDSDALSRVRLEKRINELGYLSKRFLDLLGELKVIADRYFLLLKEENDIQASSDEDIATLKSFEDLYKDFLFTYGYTSNYRKHISIQQEEPFRYFPVYKISPEDKQPQTIRINSSASDFVRNLWAYTITLLQKGSNHPGVIMLDEPGQHKIDSESLKSLFESSSKIKDKQIIIFTSIEKVPGNDKKIDLSEILKDIKEEEDYYIYKLDDVHKCIRVLK